MTDLEAFYQLSQRVNTQKQTHVNSTQHIHEPSWLGLTTQWPTQHTNLPNLTSPSSQTNQACVSRRHDNATSQRGVNNLFLGGNSIVTVCISRSHQSLIVALSLSHWKGHTGHRVDSGMRGTLPDLPFQGDVEILILVKLWRNEERARRNYEAHNKLNSTKWKDPLKLTSDLISQIEHFGHLPSIQNVCATSSFQQH